MLLDREKDELLLLVAELNRHKFIRKFKTSIVNPIIEKLPSTGGVIVYNRGQGNECSFSCNIKRRFDEIDGIKSFYYVEIPFLGDQKQYKNEVQNEEVRRIMSLNGIEPTFRIK